MYEYLEVLTELLTLSESINVLESRRCEAEVARKGCDHEQAPSPEEID